MRQEQDLTNYSTSSKFLVAEKPGFLGSKRIKWNFTKFLIDKEGRPLKRYAPQDKPESIEADIQRAL